MMETDKNSMLYWFPKIKDFGIPIPRTEIVKVSWGNDYLKYIPREDAKQISNTIKKELKMAGEKIGYPLFMRTDQLSGKHAISFRPEDGWVPKVNNFRELLLHLYRLLEESAMAGILGLPVNAIVLREYLELEAEFTAFSGMPVARERRYFINNGMVLCHHPYWIEDAIKFWQKDYKPPRNWKKLLAKINIETEEEVQLLMKYTFKVAYNLDGYWSIDFAKTKHSGWVLIDMALGISSWHPSCKQKDKMAKIYEKI